MTSKTKALVKILILISIGIAVGLYVKGEDDQTTWVWPEDSVNSDEDESIGEILQKARGRTEPPPLNTD